MIVLGIESSCDETAVALVNSKGKVLSHELLSQVKKHTAFGGVVPEVAARAHLEVIDSLILEALKKAGVSFLEVDGFAATCGPGLMGGLMIGALAAKTLSFVYNKPFIAVNHLAAHAILPTMFYDLKFPFLLLLVSGGHTQFIAVLGINEYKILGGTIDDAIGEAFDKSARLMGLPYPGGVHIQNAAKAGNKYKFNFPKPLYKQANCNFSFSGLKTAVKEIVTTITKDNLLNEQNVMDIAASLEQTIADIVLDRTTQAIKIFEEHYGKVHNLVISGGVSANLVLRNNLEVFLKDKNIALCYPPIDLCTDNGVMIAWLGIKKLQLGMVNDLSFPIKSRWSLDTVAL